MTAITIAAPTPPIPPPTVIQPVLPLTPNDNLPFNINVPTSSHLQSEFQVRDGRINALERTSNYLHHELQGRINALENAVEQMSAQLNILRDWINRTRMTTPTDIELAFQDGCTGSPTETFDFSLNTTLYINMSAVRMEECNRRGNNNLPGLDQCNNVAHRYQARTNEELRTNTP